MSQRLKLIVQYSETWNILKFGKHLATCSLHKTLCANLFDELQFTYSPLQFSFKRKYIHSLGVHTHILYR